MDDLMDDARFEETRLGSFCLPPFDGRPLFKRAF